MRLRHFEWPVIVLCAGADEAARHEARDLGAHFLLNKPVDAQALFDSITACDAILYALPGMTVD
jgi:FixJ family two-component response regulator